MSRWWPAISPAVGAKPGVRRVWYEEQFLPRIGPVALWGLLFTVVILFALQGSKITHSPFDVARIAVPLIAYFGIMWTGAFVS